MAPPPDPAPPSDEAVEAAVVRARAGEADAFGLAVDRYGRALRAWLATRCPPEVDPDEVAHVAFVTAYRSLANYQPGTNFGAWLWAIARAQLRGAISEVRRRADVRRRHAPELLRARLDALAETGPDDDEERLTALRRCVAALAEPARDLLHRRYELGQPLEQAAAELGRTVTALKMALFTVRNRLEQCIRERLAREAP